MAVKADNVEGSRADVRAEGFVLLERLVSRQGARGAAGCAPCRVNHTRRCIADLGPCLKSLQRTVLEQRGTNVQEDCTVAPQRRSATLRSRRKSITSRTRS